MKIYIAARYEDWEVLVQRKAQLEERGHRVTSRWLNPVERRQADKPWSAEELNANPPLEGPRAVAQDDLDDVAVADCLICISYGEGRRGRGGRHVEFGFAVALGHELIVVGPSEHVFHCLPQVVHYGTWEECLEDL